MEQLDTTVARIWRAIPRGQSIALPALASAAQVPKDKAATLLVFMELNGRVRQGPAGVYSRVQANPEDVKE